MFAEVLRRSLHARDVAGRWGGEEFMIVLEGRDRGTLGDPNRVGAQVPRRDAEHLASIEIDDVQEAGHLGTVS